MRNPYNSKPKVGIKLTTMDSAGGEIDYIDLTLTVTTPTGFSGLTLEISSGTIGSPAIYALFYELN